MSRVVCQSPVPSRIDQIWFLGALTLGCASILSAGETTWSVRPELQIPPGHVDADGLDRAALPGPIASTLKGVHPRIFFTAERLKELKGLVQSDPQWQAINKVFFHEEVEDAMNKNPPDTGEDMAGDDGEELWQRKVGKRIPVLALAYNLTGEAKYLEQAKKYIFKSIAYKTWGKGKFDCGDLAAGHQILGLGLGYDWLYSVLTPEERARIREVLVPRAKTMAVRAAGISGKVWWREAYLQNHLCVNCAGLAAAGFALCDEEPEANAWVRLAHGKILKVLERVMDDGASHEGYTYWTYGLVHMLEYLEMSRALLGINLYQSGGADQPWLKNGAAFALYLTAPRSLFKSPERRTLLGFGDSGPSQGHGPANMLRILAARYPTSPYAGTSMWLAQELQESGADATYEDYFLNLACFDPRVKAVSAETLPTLHHFNNLDLVVARSSWSGTESVLAVKCGPPEGHKNVNESIANSGGHAHADAGHFLFVSHGAFLVSDSSASSKNQTGFHNSLLVDGRGQKGENNKGEFDMEAWAKDRRAPRIVSAASTPGEDVIVCDAAAAYPPELGVSEFRRTFRFGKPDVVLISDKVAVEKPAALEWRFHLEGKVEKVSETSFRVTQKDAALDIGLVRGDGLRASIGKIDGKKERFYLSIVSSAKVAKADLVLILRARDAKDAAPFEPVLENEKVRVTANGKSLSLPVGEAAVQK